MRLVGTRAPADTHACIRHWPAGSAVALDAGLQTQYEGALPVDMALASELENLRLTENDSGEAAIQKLVHDTFMGHDVQRIRLRNDPSPQPFCLAAPRAELEPRITGLAHLQSHPALSQPSLSVEREGSACLAGESYAQLAAYIRRSSRGDGQQEKLGSTEMGTLRNTSRRASVSSRTSVASRSSTGSSDSSLKRPLVQGSTMTSIATKRVRTRHKGAGHGGLDQENVAELAAHVGSAPSVDVDPKEAGPSVNQHSRNVELLSDFLSEIFEEENCLSGDGNGTAALFQGICTAAASTFVLRRDTVRRIRSLLSACDPALLVDLVSGDRLNGLVGLLSFTIDACKEAGLVALLRDGALIERGAGFSSDYSHQLELAMPMACIGLEVAILAFNMTASGASRHIKSAGGLLHDAVAFLKTCLLDCVAPLLDMDASYELASVVVDARGSMHDHLCALLEATLSASNSVVAVAAQPALCEEDIVPLVYASISVVFCSGSGLRSGPGANLFESIRRSSQVLLRGVFESRPDQRTWILDEMLASLIKIPTTKRAQSIHHIAGGKSVQFITVLLLQLLQATAKSPEDLTAGFEGGELSAKEYRMLLQMHQKAVSAAASSTDFAIRYMIGRCARREGKAMANEAEYRALLEAFVDDCIVLLGHPQWPAAELVVRIYSLHIIDILDDEKSDIVLKNMSLEGAATIASHIVCLQQGRASLAGKAGSDALELISPKSSVEAIVHFRAVTTRLLEYLQSRAASSESTGAIPLYISHWASILLLALLKGSRRASECGSDQDSSGSEDSDESDDEDILGMGGEGTTASAQKRKAIEECLRDYAVVAHRSSKVMTAGTTFNTAAESAKAALSLMPLFRSFDMLLTRVTLALSASQVTLRSKALRALNQIALHRPEVLYQTNVKYAINHRLQDNSPQVREAAIDLIGKHIAHNPELTDQYYEFVSVRILDKGPSVRRRVMRILGDIYASSDRTEQLVDIGVRLLQRINDEERTIRELALKMLRELWFSYKQRTGASEEEPVAGAARNIFNTLPPKSQREILKRVHVMAGVVGAIQSRELVELMGSLFASVLGGPPSPETEEAQFVIRCVIDALFEQLIRTEESATVDDGLSGAVCLRFIATLSEIAPDTVALHTESLGGYLRLGSIAEEDALLNVLTIFRSTLLAIPHPSSVFLTSVERDLIQLLSSSPQNILSIAVPCLCELVEKLTCNYAKLIRLFRSCVLQLSRERRAICGGAQSTMAPKNVMRFVILAGLASRHFDLDKYRETQRDHFKDLEQLGSGSMLDLINDLLLFFAEARHAAPVQLAAIQMLGQLHIKQPRLALEPRAREMMDRVFGGESAGHKQQVLRGFLEFLRADAKQVADKEREDRVKESEVDAKALVGNTSGMSEAGVGASLMQTYLDRIIDATFACNVAPLRAAGFEVISLVLEQGLAHPLKCMPALIALCTSSDPYIRAKSLRLHREQSLKYASFIHSRDMEGVHKAYEYQLQVRGRSESVVGYDDSADLRDRPDRPVASLQFLYSLVRSKRTRRNELLMLLVRVCDSDAYTPNIPYARFVAENISAFEFKHLDEVLHVIYQISSVAASAGLNLHHQLEAEDGGSQRQAAEASVCIGILLVLREFLRDHYGISEARCTSYNPGDAAGVRDKAVAWHSHGNNGRIDWSACPYAVQRMTTAGDYAAQSAHFRRLMAAEVLAGGEGSPALLSSGDGHEVDADGGSIEAGDVDGIDAGDAGELGMATVAGLGEL